MRQKVMSQSAEDVKVRSTYVPSLFAIIKINEHRYIAL